MKNKKGFTLVELLAVIVILGILLLIAVPAVQNIIASSRKKAFESAAKLALENVEAAASIETTTGNGALASACVIGLDKISLERGSFEGAKGYVSVGTDGKAAIYISNGTLALEGGTMSSLSAVKETSSNKQSSNPSTTCLWYTGE